MFSPRRVAGAARPWSRCILGSLLSLAFVGAQPMHAAPETAPAVPDTASGATIIVLDASGSMRGRIGGETKMEIARRSVRELVEALPDGTPLGLVVYSHRKSGDCKDIELVIPPGPLDKAAYVKAVLAIEPRGSTPLTAAVAFAAEALDYGNTKASVILVSDGEETCGGKPCEAAVRLESLGKDFAIHAVAFDLGEKASRSFACLATETGGRFLQANDAASLKDALILAVAESTVATPPPAEKLDAATLTAPSSVVAGAAIEVAWTGPDNPGDYVTIVAAGARDDAYANFTYTRQGSPLSLTSLIEPGEAELRYVTGRSRTILARAAITIAPAGVTLEAAPTAGAGGQLMVTWTGPNNRGDFITVVPKATPEGDYAGYADTKDGSPLGIRVPIEPGECEVRYVSGQGRKVLARRPVAISAVEVSLNAADEVTAGVSVSITWTGPNNPGDYITIVPRVFSDDRYAGYTNSAQGSPLAVRAPIESGECEIRYVSGQGRKVLARRALTVVAAAVSLEAPDEVVAGSNVSVTWVGPDNSGDYITLVPKSLPDGRYGQYTNTSRGSPLAVRAPIEPGECELRYMSGQGARVLARRTVRVVAAQISLRAPASAVAATRVTVEWTGPNNPGDFITIVPKSTRDGEYKRYSATTGGSPLQIQAPDQPGPAEVRYMSSQGNTVLARTSLEITPAPAK